jgi:hypothetical protein
MKEWIVPIQVSTNKVVKLKDVVGLLLLLPLSLS